VYHVLAVALIMVLSSATRSHAQESSSGAPSYRVIVNARSPVDSLDRRALADMFLKKVKRWPADGPVLPVDLGPDSLARRRFSEEVLSRSVSGVRNYWQQLIFSGRDVPPPEFSSEEEVIRYVGRTPGSVGYVSSSTLSGLSPTGDVKALGLR
jgi:ABC-type phosphate transport system substrate-binding protein